MSPRGGGGGGLGSQWQVYNLTFQSKFSLFHPFQANFKQWFVYRERNMTENPTFKNVKSLFCTILLIIIARHAHVIFSVLALHVSCLFCKSCNFFGVSVTIMCLTWDLNLITLLTINIGRGNVIGPMMDGVLLISQTTVCFHMWIVID